MRMISLWLRRNAWRYRYWAFVWFVGCLWFFLDSPESMTSATDTLATRLRMTASFGFVWAFVLFIPIAMMFIAPEVARSSRVLGLHLWRYRWVYVLLPASALSLVGLLATFTNERPTTSGDSVFFELLSAAIPIALVTGLLMWNIAFLYAATSKKMKWLLAIVLFPPSVLVLFFLPDTASPVHHDEAAVD